ncbi:unnamed protein product [Cladocopium goreaui]|uniref:Uncharacterized protein n=1 Tax=Cladocopium goreaui TaxID=2562237 RepID=A0A9P1BFA8_9DINO|nr:unnamed protein product [Cladocopium goreaui]
MISPERRCSTPCGAAGRPLSRCCRTRARRTSSLWALRSMPSAAGHGACSCCSDCRRPGDPKKVGEVGPEIMKQWENYRIIMGSPSNHRLINLCKHPLTSWLVGELPVN